ncbi:hypothetical protein [Streptomyces sp. ICBB 8177]|uniref:hypothetical protein n=1 Tax=Streptomyces sp. ICBB 8177 TaxID=563922 RepID=UPI0018EE6866|nr:hypothetical protein [Streptomyces sp. ICBB 8177]
MGAGVDNGAPRPAPPPRPAHPPGLIHGTPPGYATRPGSAPPAPQDAARRAGHVTKAARAAVAAGVCLVLGVGLLAGALVGHWVDNPAQAQTGPDATARAFTEARSAWHGVPVDSLFPPTVKGTGAGPGGADRTWIRVGVAPDGGCAGAFDPPLAAALAPLGCARLLRATYTDATSSDVTTVGVLVTTASPAATAAFSAHWTSSHLGGRTDAMPRPVAFPGTDSAGFGTAQRASWTVNVSAGLPLVVYAVSGFADGRTAGAPQPAAAATVRGATTVPAQSGLGYDAAGLAQAIAGRYTAAVPDALDPGGPGQSPAGQGTP